MITPGQTDIWNRENKRYVYYGFSESDYLTFAAWMQDVLRYIRQQQEVIEYYRDAPS